MPDPGGAVTTSRGSFRNESLTACDIAPTGKCNGILCIVILYADVLTIVDANLSVADITVSRIWLACKSTETFGQRPIAVVKGN